jgi:hypothetical protein
MVIKIISGYYRNLTYNLDSTYTFDKSKLKRSDYKFVAALESNNLEESLISKHLESNLNFDGKHLGLSRIDNCPIFKIDALTIRQNRIDELLS